MFPILNLAGHHIKNESTLAARAAFLLPAYQRIILTGIFSRFNASKGTPLQNDLSELHSLLRFVMPDVFNSDISKNLFAQAYDRGTFKRDEDFVRAASEALQILMLRRLKIDLPELSIPNMEEIDVFLPISPAQRAIYKALLMRLDAGVLYDLLEADDNASEQDRAAIKALTNGKHAVVDSQMISHLLSQLRKVSNHPYSMFFHAP